MATRLSLAGGLLLCVAVAQLGTSSCQTLRGRVACLDCAPAQCNLSGVVVAVKCSNGKGLRVAETDDRGHFQVAMPAALASGCAARVLGGPVQLCAPQRFTVSPVVVAGRRAGSYSLGSRLAVFTRCSPRVAAVAMSTTAAGDQRPPPRPVLPVPAPLLWTPVQSPPRSGSDSPPYNLELPLIYLFPFLPIIGGAIP